MEEVDKYAKIVWEYMKISDGLEKADAILVLCSNDIRVAHYASQLFFEGWAPFIVFSGGVAHKDDLLSTNWNLAEADFFMNIAVEKGEPKDKIFIENKAKNTGENILFSRVIMEEHSLIPKKLILVQKPFMERRTYATFKKVWTEPEIFVTSPKLDFNDYFNEDLPKEKVINIMVGDLVRVR